MKTSDFMSGTCVDMFSFEIVFQSLNKVADFCFLFKLIHVSVTGFQFSANWISIFSIKQDCYFVKIMHPVLCNQIVCHCFLLQCVF
jgi:hypothetical protein